VEITTDVEPPLGGLVTSGASADHVAPPLSVVDTVPPATPPTIQHWEELTQEMPSMAPESGKVCCAFQEAPPSVVARMSPELPAMVPALPTAQQSVELAQDMPETLPGFAVPP
jgi:hypothetical protein